MHFPFPSKCYNSDYMLPVRVGLLLDNGRASLIEMLLFRHTHLHLVCHYMLQRTMFKLYAIQ